MQYSEENICGGVFFGWGLYIFVSTNSQIGWEWVRVEDHDKLSLGYCQDRVPINDTIVTHLIVSEPLLLEISSIDFLYFIFPKMAKLNVQNNESIKNERN